MNNAIALTPDQLEWVWAYREQLKLLDGFDAEGLHCAETKWEIDSWKRFLNTYGLKRGPHSALWDKSEDILKAVTPLFKAPLGRTDTAKELTARWCDGVTRIGAITQRTEHDKTVNLWSMASKLLWFYQPQEMTMFDTYAVRALRELRGSVKGRGLKKLDPQDFLSEFETLFVDKRNEMIEASTLSDRKYPYLRRVLDKWLWLNGSGKKQVYLNQFQWSLGYAPLQAVS